MPLIGASPPQSIADQSDEAILANAVYEGLVGDALTRHAWSFATKSQALSYQGTTGDTPAYAYSLPSDVLTPRYMLYGNSAWFEYQLRGNKVLLDLKDEAGQFKLVYNWRAPESSWPADFSEGIVLLLASRLAHGMEMPTRAQNLKNESDQKLRQARVRDSRSYRGPKRNPDPVLVRAWRGGVNANVTAGSTAIQDIPDASS